MARSRTIQNYNNFIGGKVSDFNPVNPPEGVSRTLKNVDVELEGTCSRRLGLELETGFNFPTDVNNFSTNYLGGHTLDDLIASDIYISTWDTVDNVPGLTYYVIRIGHRLYIYDASGETLSDSLVRVVNIEPHILNENTAASGVFSTTSGKGLLICVGEGYKPFYVKCDIGAGNAWSTHDIDIRIRDFEGVDDGLKVDERPTTLSDEHRYNLENQGWLQHIDSFGYWEGKYPSNADLYYWGKTTESDGRQSFKTYLAFRDDLGETNAPKGRFIIDPFDQGSRGEVSGIPNLPQGTINQRPKAVKFFAGRAWYAAVNGTIYYSKILNSEDDLGVCYQFQDPTNEILNELLDTDGGTLLIPDVGDALALETYADSLLVFGTNGIWMISGGDTGFSANQQMVAKISNIGISSYKSIVATGDSVYFWSEEGIFVVQAEFQVSSIIMGRMQKDYNRIPGPAKATAQGVHDRREGKIYWFYSQYNTGEGMKSDYTDALVYSRPLNAFWDYHLSDEGMGASTAYPVLCGGFTPSFNKTSTIEEPITTLDSIAGLMFLATTNPAINGSLVTINGNESDSDLYKQSSSITYGDGAFIRKDANTIRYLASDYKLYRSDTGGDSWYVENTNITDSSHLPVQKMRTGRLAVSNNGVCVLLVNSSTIDSTKGLCVSDDYGETWTYTEYTSNPNAQLAHILGTYSGYIFWNEATELFVAYPSRFLYDKAVPANCFSSIATSADGVNWVVYDSGMTQWFVDDTSGLVNLDFRVDDVYMLDETLYGVLIGRDYSGLSDINDGIYAGNPISLGSTRWLYGTGCDKGYGTITRNKGTGRLLCYHNDTSLPDPYDGYVFVSDNLGITWTQYDTVNEPYQLYREPSFIYMDQLGKLMTIGVEYLGGTVKLYTSIDGVTWTSSGWSSIADVTLLVDYLPLEVTRSETVTLSDDSTPVTLPRTVAGYSLTSTIKLALLIPDQNDKLNLTFGQFSSRYFRDWVGLAEGELDNNPNYSNPGFPVSPYEAGDYDSIIESLPLTLGAPAMQKQGLYCYTFFDYSRNGFSSTTDPTLAMPDFGPPGEWDGGEIIPGDWGFIDGPTDDNVDHGALLTVKWDWTYRVGAGRWTRPQQAIEPQKYYIPEEENMFNPLDTGFGVLKSKRKIRGKGYSLVVEYKSEPGKDFRLLGWTIPYEIEDPV